MSSARSVPVRPLSGALAEASGTAPYWPVRVANSGGPAATAFTDLADEQVAGALVAGLEEQLGGGPALAAQVLVAVLAGPICGLPAELLFRARRVPVPEPAGMAVDIRLGGAERPCTLYLAPRTRLLVLADDPLAGAPGVDTARDVRALRAALVEHAHDVFAPIVETVSAVSRRGRRALWQVVADRIAGGILMAGRQFGQVGPARDEVEATLLDTVVRPLRLRPEWLEVEHEGGVELVKRRAVCCLYYKSRELLGRYCTSCPLLSREDALTRLRADVARRPA